MSSIRTFPDVAKDLADGIPVHNSAAYSVASVWQDRIRSKPGISWPDLLTQTAELVGRKSLTGLPTDQVIRAGLSTAGVAGAFSGLVNLQFFAGYESVPNSFDGWVTYSALPNFLPAHAVGVLEEARLSRSSREPAHDGYFGIFAENWGLGRYTATLSISEIDLVNAPTVDLSMAAVRALGRAAAMIAGDLLFGLLLRNPVTARDQEHFFATAHGNYATGGGSALGEDSLDAAMAAVASQSSPDNETPIAIPTFTQPKYLVVSPPLLGPARRLARRMALYDKSDLAVVPEPRLQLGVADPATETLVAGSETSWMLASPASIGPSVILGGLDGPPRPQLRSYDLAGPGWAAGIWGKGWEVKLNIAAGLLDPRGIFWSGGA